MKRTLCLLLLIGAWPLAAAATDEPQPKPRAGAEAWLEMQREGRIASPKVQSATAAERERSQQRWLNSFEQPIPAWFETAESGDSGG